MKLCILFSFVDTFNVRHRGKLKQPSLKVLSFMEQQQRELISPTKPCNKPMNTTYYPFQDIFLAINFNHPHYQNMLVLEQYYKPLFPNRIFCGPRADSTAKYPLVVIDQPPREYGHYGYQCLVEAIRRNPGYVGYLYVNDDMIVNWWNFLSLDTSKLWFPERIDPSKGLKMGTAVPQEWWLRTSRGRKCAESFENMKKDPKFTQTDVLKIFYKNTMHKDVCVAALSDIFYVPGRLADRFKQIGQLFYENWLFLEVATPMALIMLDSLDNFVIIEGKYLQRKYGWSPWTLHTERAWFEYNYQISFLHPYKFVGADRNKNTGEFKERVAKISALIIKDRCLDVISQKVRY